MLQGDDAEHSRSESSEEEEEEEAVGGLLVNLDEGRAGIPKSGAAMAAQWFKQDIFNDAALLTDEEDEEEERPQKKKGAQPAAAAAAAQKRKAAAVQEDSGSETSDDDDDQQRVRSSLGAGEATRDIVFCHGGVPCFCWWWGWGGEISADCGALQ